MLEGVFAAMVGALVAGVVVLLSNEFLFSRVGNFLQFLGPVFDFSAGEILWVLALLVIVGAGIGIVGSMMALRRFLEV
jgi:cell division protein FtsX